MRVVAIDHVQLAMPRGGEDEARAFYVGVLGLDELPKPEVLAARGGCWFATGPVQVHLGVEDDFRPARKAHPALVVEDLDSLIEGLVRHGYQIREGEPVNGRLQRFTDDPFGNRIELVELNGAAPTDDRDQGP